MIVTKKKKLIATAVAVIGMLLVEMIFLTFIKNQPNYEADGDNKRLIANLLLQATVILYYLAFIELFIIRFAFKQTWFLSALTATVIIVTILFLGWPLTEIEYRLRNNQIGAGSYICKLLFSQFGIKVSIGSIVGVFMTVFVGSTFLAKKYEKYI
jgi:hypothetical protein